MNKELAIEYHSNFSDKYREYGIQDKDYDDAYNYLNQILEFYGQTENNQGHKIDTSNEENQIKQINQISTFNLQHYKEVKGFAFNLFRNSMYSSRKTYERVSKMSYIIFGVGIVLFTISSIAGLIQGKEAFSIAFGALGVSSFVTFFIFSPSKNAQAALSNLIQTEVIFMNFWNQLHFWAKFGISDDLKEKLEASNKLQNITRELVSLLDNNISKNKGIFNKSGEKNKIPKSMQNHTTDNSKNGE